MVFSVARLAKQRISPIRKPTSPRALRGAKTRYLFTSRTQRNTFQEPRWFSLVSRRRASAKTSLLSSRRRQRRHEELSSSLSSTSSSLYLRSLSLCTVHLVSTHAHSVLGHMASLLIFEPERNAILLSPRWF